MYIEGLSQCRSVLGKDSDLQIAPSSVYEWFPLSNCYYCYGDLFPSKQCGSVMHRMPLFAFLSSNAVNGSFR